MNNETNLQEIEEIKKGCGKKFKPYQSELSLINFNEGICGTYNGSTYFFCDECNGKLQGFSLGRQSAINEVLDFINKERDNGNCEGGGFSAGICLSDLIKKLKNGEENEN